MSRTPVLHFQPYNDQFYDNIPVLLNNRHFILRLPLSETGNRCAKVYGEQINAVTAVNNVRGALTMTVFKDGAPLAQYTDIPVSTPLLLAPGTYTVTASFTGTYSGQPYTLALASVENEFEVKPQTIITKVGKYAEPWNSADKMDTLTRPWIKNTPVTLPQLAIDPARVGGSGAGEFDITYSWHVRNFDGSAGTQIGGLGIYGGAAANGPSAVGQYVLAVHSQAKAATPAAGYNVTNYYPFDIATPWRDASHYPVAGGTYSHELGSNDYRGITITGEGFTEAEQDKFEAAAEDFITKFLDTDPVKRVAERFCFFIENTMSAGSGLSKENGAQIDTYYGFRLNEDGSLGTYRTDRPMDTIVFQEVWRRDTNTKTWAQWGATVVLINEEEIQANYNWRHPEANRAALLSTIADKGYQRLIESMVTQFAHMRSNRDMDLLDTYRWMDIPGQPAPNKTFGETLERLIESCYSHEMYGSGNLNLPRPVIVSDAASKLYISDGVKVLNWDVPQTFKAYSFGHELRINTVAADTFTYRYYTDKDHRVGTLLPGAPVNPGFYWAEADLPTGAKYFARTETDRYGFTYNAGQQLPGVNGGGTANSARVRGFVRFEIVPSTYDNLYASVQGETNAAAAYRAFAAQAQAEGYPAIANLFSATADAEAKHADDEWAILQSMGASERPLAATPTVGTTAQNLQTAFDGETYEYTVMYPGFVKVAQIEGLTEAARIFNLALRAEEVHAGNYADVLALLQAGDIADLNVKYDDIYRCPVCGEVVTERPGFCPICGAAGDTFISYIPQYNFRVSLQSAQSALAAGDILAVDVMLAGNINYTQINTAIAYDANMLEFTGYANLSGLAAEVRKDSAGKISVRSVPSLNMLLGALCIPPVKVVTLQFMAKDNFADTAISFAAIAVTPAAGAKMATTAPGKPLPLSEGQAFTTYDALYASVQGETNAAAAYRAFAGAAWQDGFAAIARLFFATADAEAKHADDEWAILQSMGATVRPVAETPVLGATLENLLAAFAGETYEYTVMYPKFLAKAQAEGNTDAARIFNLAMKAEEVHAGNFADVRTLLLASDIGAINTKYGVVYRCPICGEVVTERPASRCPICGALGDTFAIYNQTYINLNDTVRGEAYAAASYRAYAEKALAEGYPAIARLFTATADAEAKNAEDAWTLLKNMGAPERPPLLEPSVSTTLQNLQAAWEGENWKYLMMFNGFAEIAQAEGMTAVAGFFGTAYKAVAVHLGNFADMRALLQANDVAGINAKYAILYRCPLCGEVVTELPAAICPICSAPRASFVTYN